jgi:hypothetical protein
MMRKCFGCLVVLLGVVCLFCFAGKADAAKPDKLIKVTLECDEEFGVMPLRCLGADVVNLTGKGRDTNKGPKRFAFDCLPGGVVCVIGKGFDSDTGAFLIVMPEDDGKTIRMQFGTNSVRKNGVLCTLKLPPPNNAKQLAEQLDILKQAKKAKQIEGLTVILDGNAANESVLSELKGSGVGILLQGPPGTGKLSDAALQRFYQAIVEVEPRLLEIDRQRFDLVKDRLPKLESLSLVDDAPSGVAIPDLSKLTKLKHLLFVAEKVSGAIDAKPLEKLTQLKALTIFTPEHECKNANAIGSLGELEFLAVTFKSPCDASAFHQLLKLRYLAATFSTDANFSFAEKMPDLQTFCILNVEEKHNLKPLEKLPHLRCLALSLHPEGDHDTSDFEAKNFKNVKEFEKARPDVEVVEYRGICLGSFWLLPLAAAAAVAAWLVRRRRVGRRLACQQ